MKNIACKLKMEKDLIYSKFRKGDSNTTIMVVSAAIGTIVLIGFYLVAKDGLGSWGESFKKLVSM